MKKTLLALAAAATLAPALQAEEWWYTDLYPWVFSSDDGWNWVATEDDGEVYTLVDGNSPALVGGDNFEGGWWYTDLYPWIWSTESGWQWVWNEQAEILLFSANGDTIRFVPERTVNSSSSASPYIGSYMIENEEYGTMVTVTVSDTTRSISANGLPNHETTGLNSPNAVSAQSYSYEFPVNPTQNASGTAYNIPQPFGIAFNGIIIDPFAAEWYNDDRNSGWQLAALNNRLGWDVNNAHVQPDGTYHYHGSPTSIITESDKPQLLGFAGDGFPIYSSFGYSDANDATSTVRELKTSFQVKAGTRPSGPGGTYDGTYIEDHEFVDGSGDLDDCNGRFGVTPEFPNGTYHYVVTNEWPFVGRSFRGNIATSFEKAGGGPPR